MLFSITACNEQIKAGNTLTAQELEYLRNIAAVKCVATTDKDFENFEENTNDIMLNFQPGNTWKYEYKKDTTVVETSYLYVWKVSPPHVYFRLKLSDAGTTKNQFVKFDTTQNIEMMENLQEQECAKTLDLSVGSSSMSATIKTGRVTEDADTQSETDTLYTISASYPPYFAYLNRKKTKRIYNNDDVLQKTEIYDYIITSASNTTQPTSYTDSTIINKEYCVVKYTNPTPPDTLNNYTFPFSLQCGTSDTAGPDANGDAVEDFDPATEL